MASLKAWESLIKRLKELGYEQMELIHIAPLEPPRGDQMEIAYLFEKATGQTGKIHLLSHLCHTEECNWDTCKPSVDVKAKKA